MSLITIQSGPIKYIGSSEPVIVPSEELPLSITASGANQVVSFGFVPSYLTTALTLIGDSQGAGVFQSNGHGIAALLSAAFSGLIVGNLCQVGYNSRRLMPDGSNGYVDTAHNITKALTDGAKIIVVIDTSNDSDTTNDAGGIVPLDEWKVNLQVIHDTAVAAGARILFVSTFPRSQLSLQGQQQQVDMYEWELSHFGAYLINCYYVVADPTDTAQLRPSYNHGDDIHLNDAGAAAVADVIIAGLYNAFIKGPSERSNIVIQSADSSTGPWSNVSVITDPTINTYTTTKNLLYYRAMQTFRDGTQSAYSSIVQGLGPGGNTPPVANAGNNQTVTLPTTSVTLHGSGTDTDGTITGYEWTQVSGPNDASILNPISAETEVLSLIEGTYVFNLEVTDNNGGTDSDTTQVQVNGEVSTTPGKWKVAKTSAGSTPVSGFNDVIGGFLLAGNFNGSWPDIEGGSGLTLHSAVTNSLTATAKWGVEFGTTGNVGDDNGETIDDGGGFLPAPGVQRSGAFNNGVVNPGEQFFITGGTPDQQCRIDVYGSLMASFGLDASPMVVSVAGETAQFDATGATSRYGSITTTFDSNGEIRNISVAPLAGQAQFAMFNAIVAQPL